MTSAENKTGGCQCGAVRYEISGTPSETYICHCTECRRQSASAFGISVIVHPDQLRVTAGEPKKWTRPTDSGGQLDCYFCPTCGSRLWHGDPSGTAVLSIKGGGLDVPPDLTSAAHIWVSRKLDGIVIPPGVPVFEGEPD